MNKLVFDGDTRPFRVKSAASAVNDTAGIHVDSLLKTEAPVDAHSGAAGIAYWINAHMGLSLDKKSPVVAHVKEAVDALYMTGRTVVMSDGELARFTKAALAAGEPERC